ncbi:MAG: hypothetical protein NXI24_04500 [bacterium]|nr:hypothetical protein [bacterium]
MQKLTRFFTFSVLLLTLPLSAVLAGGGGSSSNKSDLDGTYIVLAHGILGWDDDTRDGTVFNKYGLPYWGGMDEHLRGRGARVMTDGKSALAHSYDRAEQMRYQINLWLASESADNKKIHILSHSQGGMDSRILASPGGLAGLSNAHGNRIASVTTISSPHYGTSFADVLLGLIPGSGIQNLLAGLVNTIAGLIYNGELIINNPNQDLLAATFMAVGEMDIFNANFHDAASVKYFSTGSKIRAWNIFEHNPLLLPLYLANLHGGTRLSSPQIGEIGKENDGAIPYRSMRWGKWISGPKEKFYSTGVDHLQITNAFYSGQLWFDVKGFYNKLAENAKNSAL